MSDLKEFLEKEQKSGIVNVNKLGLFFWERGGKQFVIFNIGIKTLTNGFKVCVEDAKHILNNKKNYFYMRMNDAQDFLDCVACWGVDKVKEEIAKLSKE